MAEPMSTLTAELKATEHVTELGATEQWTEGGEGEGCGKCVVQGVANGREA